MHKALALTFIAAALSACASVQDGVITTPDGHLRMLTEQASGFATPDSMKAVVRDKAARHCAQSGQEVELLSIKATEPPYILGNFPSAQIDFRCVAPKPADAKR